MKKPALTFNPKPIDDEERETMKALDRAFDEGTLVSRLTPERQAELQEAASNTLKLIKKKTQT